MAQFLRFGIVGAIGFVIDAGALYLAIALGAGLYWGRIASYLAAVITTWILNRRYTFPEGAGDRRVEEFGRFAVSQLSGATLNLGTYTVLVSLSAWIASHPVVAVAAGSLAGMAVNFLVARRYVFNGSAPSS